MILVIYLRKNCVNVTTMNADINTSNKDIFTIIRYTNCNNIVQYRINTSNKDKLICSVVIINIQYNET